jgi:hypothetical protein
MNMSFLREMEAAAERVERENQGLSAEQIARIDRKIVPRILGHLHIAAETLLEGRISTAEKIKHGMKKLLHAIERKIQEETAASGIGMPPSHYGPDLGVGELTLPAPESVQSWNKFIEY